MSHYSVLWAMDRNELHSQINRMYEQGYRVLSVVYAANESPNGYTVVYEVREEEKPPLDTSWMRTPFP